MPLHPTAAQGPRREAQLQLRALMAAWQRVLPEFFPQMAEDTVEGGQMQSTAFELFTRATRPLCIVPIVDRCAPLCLLERLLTTPWISQPPLRLHFPSVTLPTRRGQHPVNPRGAHHRPTHRVPAGAPHAGALSSMAGREGSCRPHPQIAIDRCGACTLLGIADSSAHPLVLCLLCLLHRRATRSTRPSGWCPSPSCRT